MGRKTYAKTRYRVFVRGSQMRCAMLLMMMMITQPDIHNQAYTTNAYNRHTYTCKAHTFQLVRVYSMRMRMLGLICSKLILHGICCHTGSAELVLHPYVLRRKHTPQANLSIGPHTTHTNQCVVFFRWCDRTKRLHGFRAKWKRCSTRRTRHNVAGTLMNVITVRIRA